jgi:hypothetical protein
MGDIADEIGFEDVFAGEGVLLEGKGAILLETNWVDFIEDSFNAVYFLEPSKYAVKNYGFFRSIFNEGFYYGNG